MIILVDVALLSSCAHSLRPGSTAAHTVSRASEVAGLPDTPAAVALRDWLRIYNLGLPDSARAFAARAYSPTELADRPADVIARGHQLWRMNYGQMRVVRVDSSTPVAIEATVHEAVTEAYGKVFVEVDSTPPHGITGVWLIPFVEPPANAPRVRRSTDLSLAGALGRYTDAWESRRFSPALCLWHAAAYRYSRAPSGRRLEIRSHLTHWTRALSSRH